MHCFTAAAAVALVAARLIMALDVQGLQALVAQKTPQVSGGYIVELSVPPQDFIDELQQRAAGQFRTRTTYSSTVFNGVALHLQTPEDLVHLQSIPNVVAVRPIMRIPRPNSVSSVIQTSAVPVAQAPHAMTGVDKLHAEGIAGKGVKVAVIDTGVDYFHDSLGGGFGPGFKISGGYDLVGDNYYGDNEPEPDDDPMDCDGHGTHVTGIIAANPGNSMNMSGVAYDANILAYRIFGCVGDATDDIAIDALLRAYDAGADIISMSFGDPFTSQSSLSVVAERLAQAGRVVVAAIGNQATDGVMVPSAPSSSPSVLAVGSVDNIIVPAAYITTNAPHDDILYDKASFPNPVGIPIDLPDKPYPVYALSRDPDELDTACEVIGDDVPDLGNYAVVVRSNLTRCDPYTQADNLQAKGARVVLYFDVTQSVYFPLYDYFSAVILRSHQDAAFLISESAVNPNLTVTFPSIPTGVPNADRGGLSSASSTFGPSYDLRLKPALSTPGGNIISTFPLGQGAWAVLSGTNIAAPYAAGSAALVLQAKGKSAAKNVRQLLQSTSVSVPITKHPGAIANTLTQQGAGLVNIYNALKVRSSVSPSELLLNDTAHWRANHFVTIRNDADTAQTYNIGHEAAMTIQSKPRGHSDFYSGSPRLISAPARVQLLKSNVMVQPGKTATIPVSIQPPADIDSEALPIVSGWVTIIGSLGDSLRVSYLGMAGSLLSAQVISTGNTIQVAGGLPAIIPSFLRAPAEAQHGPRNYTREEIEAAVFGLTISLPSPRIVIDLVGFDTKVKANVPHPENAFITLFSKHKWSWSWPSLRQVSSEDTFSQVPTLGRLVERKDNARNSVTYFWNAWWFPTTFANGTGIPIGQYKLLVRVLRPGGEWQKQNDYDIYTSEQFGFVGDGQTSVGDLAIGQPIQSKM
ncbi:subtilisin-like protein [Auriculariales sp. MPI-PUGE-AT-0066]|nr:subtilisin-like protein [Auriculariales sp. MPI-PUGE-AT-0066]